MVRQSSDTTCRMIGQCITEVAKLRKDVAYPITVSDTPMQMTQAQMIDGILLIAQVADDADAFAQAYHFYLEVRSALHQVACKRESDLHIKLADTRDMLARMQTYCERMIETSCGVGLDDDEMTAIDGIIADDIDLGNLREIFPKE